MLRSTHTLTALAMFVATAGCTREILAPESRGDRWVPPDSLWQQMVDCSGLAMPAPDRLPFWYLSPGDSVFFNDQTQHKAVGALAVIYLFDNYVVVARNQFDRPGVGIPLIRHEMLHELLYENLGQINGHPPEYFIQKCGHLVVPPGPNDF